MTTELIRTSNGDQIIIDGKIFVGPNRMLGLVVSKDSLEKPGDIVAESPVGGKIVVRNLLAWSGDTLRDVVVAMKTQMILDHMIKENQAATIKDLTEKLAKVEAQADSLQDQLNFTVDDGK